MFKCQRKWEKKFRDKPIGASVLLLLLKHINARHDGRMFCCLLRVLRLSKSEYSKPTPRRRRRRRHTHPNNKNGKNMIIFGGEMQTNTEH